MSDRLGVDFTFRLPLSKTHCGIWMCDVNSDCRSGFREKGTQGKEVTPYILQRVNELTSGRSLQASIHLTPVNFMTLSLQLRAHTLWMMKCAHLEHMFNSFISCAV